MATDNIEWKVAEVNGNLVVQDAAGNIIGKARQTDEQKAALAAAKAAKAAGADTGTGDSPTGADTGDTGITQDKSAQEDAAAPNEPEAPTLDPVTPAQSVSTPPNEEFELPLSASGSSRLVITELKEYIAKMSSKVRMSAADGGQAQTMLYHILLQAINTKAEEFDMVFGLMMKLIRANLNGCFSDTVVHRYTPHVTLSATQASTLRYLLNVLTALADPAPEARKLAMRQVNIEQALGARLIKEEARQRVMAFFNYQ